MLPPGIPVHTAHKVAEAFESKADTAGAIRQSVGRNAEELARYAAAAMGAAKGVGYPDGTPLPMHVKKPLGEEPLVSVVRPAYLIVPGALVHEIEGFVGIGQVLAVPHRTVIDLDGAGVMQGGVHRFQVFHVAGVGVIVQAHEIPGIGVNSLLEAEALGLGQGLHLGGDLLHPVASGHVDEGRKIRAANGEKIGDVLLLRDSRHAGQLSKMGVDLLLARVDIGAQVLCLLAPCPINEEHLTPVALESGGVPTDAESPEVRVSTVCLGRENHTLAHTVDLDRIDADGTETAGPRVGINEHDGPGPGERVQHGMAFHLRGPHVHAAGQARGPQRCVDPLLVLPHLSGANDRVLSLFPRHSRGV